MSSSFAIAVDVSSRECQLVHAGDDEPNLGPRRHVWIVGQRDREQRLGVLIPDVQLPSPSMSANSRSWIRLAGSYAESGAEAEARHRPVQ